MAKKRAKSLLTRQQKLFRMPKINLIDANAIDVEEAVSRLFIFLRTGGRLIRRTDKPIFSGDGPDAETPAAVVNTVLDEAGEKFHGINNDQRRSLIASWFDSHFAMTSRRGKKAGGEYRMSGLRPLHYAIIKLFNPRVRSQDRYLSDFFYNAIREAAAVAMEDDFSGEVVKACISLVPGEELSEQNIIDYCAERLVKYKVPKVVEFFDELPKTGPAKIDKLKLRRLR